MSFFDVARHQRAHRVFTSAPVPDALIEQLLETAVCAPSAENTQPWEFVVVRDAAVRGSLAAAATRMWEMGGREYARPHLSAGLFAEVDAWATGGLADAPVHVVVCGDTSHVADAMLASSIFPAVQNILLGALAVGLGSLLSTLAVVDRGPVASILGLPDNVIPLALVPIGYPARSLGPPRRSPYREHTHRDTFGTPW